jgi:hypothetical protein
LALVALFLIAAFSLLIVSIGSTAFRMTGLSRDVSDFQSLSCYFGVGFTTREAEMIVSHPVRRKIASYLIVIGNIGVISAFGALMMSFAQDGPDWLDILLHPDDQELPFLLRIVVTIVGVLGVVFILRLGLLKHLIEFVIQRALERSGVVRVMDLDTMLRAGHGYVVSEYEVDPGHPLVGRSLGDSMLGQRGVLILGIDRDDKEFVGAPNRRTLIEEGDVLTVYGKENRIATQLTPEATLAAVSGQNGTVI